MADGARGRHPVNCVINPSPTRPPSFREAYRVLRPGNRPAVSDMITRGLFITPEERANMSAWAGCVTGAEMAPICRGHARCRVADIDCRQGAPDGTKRNSR